MLNLGTTITESDLLKLKSEIVVHDLHFKFAEPYRSQYLTAVDEFVFKMSRRGQSCDYYAMIRNASKPVLDNRNGKYGEAALIYALAYCGFPGIDLDVAERHGSGKGWVCDLPYSGINATLPDIHVKTCDLSTQNFLSSHGRSDKYSWTFQYDITNAGRGRDMLFSDMESDDLVALMYVPTIDSGDAVLYATAPWKLLVNKMRPPMSDMYVGQKLCISGDV